MKHTRELLAFGLTTAVLAAGCSAPREVPDQTPRPTIATTEVPVLPMPEMTGGVESEPIVDIGAMALNGALPLRVKKASKAVVRVQADVKNAGRKYRTGGSGVRVLNAYHYLTAGHVLIAEQNTEFTPSCGDVRVSQVRGGNVVVERPMARAGATYDGVSDIGAMQATDPSVGSAAKISAEPLNPGQVVYAAGYRTPHPENVPINESVQLSLYSAIFLGSASNRGVIVEGVGRSYGERQANTGGVGMSGGPLMDEAGKVHGIIVSAPEEHPTVGDVEDQLHVDIQRDGKPVADNTKLQVTYIEQGISDVGLELLIDNSQAVGTANAC